MIHHETVRGKLASENGGSGHFDVISNDGIISIYEEGHCHGSGYDSVEVATKSAQELANQYDQSRLGDLKRQWLEDSSWDIETTEGFEEFKQELYIFRLETELASAKKREKHMHSILGPFAALLKDYLPAAS